MTSVGKLRTIILLVSAFVAGCASSPESPSAKESQSTAASAKLAGAALEPTAAPVQPQPRSALESKAANLLQIAGDGTEAEIREAIRLGADPNVVDEQGWTPLALAVARNQDAGVVAALIEAGAQLDYKGPNGVGLLHVATVSGNPARVKMLLKAGVDGDSKDADGLTALFYAISDPEMMGTLLREGLDANARSNHGVTPLMSAAVDGDEGVVQVLLNAGADVNSSATDGTTALMLAAAYNQMLSMTDLLLRGGADVNARTVAGIPVLSYAVNLRPDPEITRALIAAGADVNYQDKEGRSPLMYAVRYDPEPALGSFESLDLPGANIGVVQLLLEAGSRLNERDATGRTALMYAAEVNPYPDVLDLLLSSGADARAVCSDGRTAVDFANGNERLRGTPAFTELVNALRH